MPFRRQSPPSNSDIPRGFKGRRRVLAVVVRAALKQAGYECHFLSQGGSGLHIGTDGLAAIAVGKMDPKAFSWEDAQACAAKLNVVFQRIAPSAQIATPVRGKTSIGSVPYAEVQVVCSSNSMLRALSRGLAR